MIEICFPFEIHGVGIASIELIGGFFNFLGAPILSDFEETGTLDALKLSIWISGVFGALVSSLRSSISDQIFSL